MTVELSTEDLAYIEDLVKSGRFPSVDDAVHAAMALLISTGGEPVWTGELQSAVDAGVAAQQQHDFASDADMDMLFERFQQKSA